MSKYEVEESDVQTFSAEVTEQAYTDPTEMQRGSEAAYDASVASGRGEDGERVYDQVNNDPDYLSKSAEDLAAKHSERYISDLNERIETGIAAGSPPSTEEVTDSLQSFQSANMGVWQGYRDEVEGQPYAADLTDSEKDEYAIMSYLQHQAMLVGDEMGFGDYVVDIGSFLGPDVENIRMNEVAKIVGMEYTAMDALDYSDFLGRLSVRIKTLPPEEAVKVVDSIVDGWEDILGDNRIMLKETLMNLTGNYDRDSLSLFAKFGVADQAVTTATIVGGIATSVPKWLIKTTNVINRAVKSGNVKGASMIVSKGLAGGLVRGGVDVLDAAATIVPGGQTLMKMVPGSNSRMAAQILKTQQAVGLNLAKVEEVSEYGLALKPAERELAISREVKALQKEDVLTDILHVEQDAKGFKIQYRVGAEGEERVRESFFKVSDSTTFESDGIKGYSALDAHITSPLFRFKDDGEMLVQLPAQMNFQAGAIRESYDKAIRGAVGSLNKGEFKKIDALLLQGDEAEKVYTAQELLSGTTGVVYTEKEVAAYKGIRQVVDHMHYAKDKQILDMRNAQGIKIVDWADDSVPMKRYDDANAARMGFEQSSTHTHAIGVMKADGSITTHRFEKASDMSEEWITDKYGKGFRLAKVTEGRFIKGEGTNLEWALVKDDAFMPPSPGALGQRTGYMPKIAKDGHFFVKQESTLNIGGKEVSGIPHTLRYFDNHADAVTWMERQPDTSKLHVLADGEMTAAAREAEYTNISRGQFTGARKKTSVPFGLEEKAQLAERESALHGLQRYVNHLSKQMPISLFRAGIRERWEKTAKDLGVVPGGATGSFDDLLLAADTKHPSYGFVKDSHAQVGLISGVPTASEKSMMAKTSAIALWFERKGLGGIAKKLHGKNIVDSTLGTVRGATFHSLLGMYNPAQYLVQASGGLIALSVNPIHAAKAVPQSMAYQVLDRMIASKPAKMDTYLAWMEKKGLDVDGYKAWDKSGIKQSITSSNLDYEGLWANLPYDAGTIRKVMANDTFFFKSGELVSARLSFATAFNRWKSMNPGKATPDADDMQSILARTENFRLDMSKANAAKFQTGVISGATQFQQVNTKFMEKLFGSSFTVSEKTRMAAGQIAFFGAAGVPLVGYITPVFLDMAGLNAANLSEEEMRAVRNGALTWFFNDFMDVEAVVSGRMTLGGDLLEKVMNTSLEGQRIVEIIAGPSYSLFDKGHNLIFNVGNALSADFSAEGMESSKVALVAEVLARSTAQFAGPLANSIKAYDMTHSQFYKNGAGRPIFEWGEVNTQTMLFQAAGFSPQAVADFYEVHNRDGGTIPTAVKNGEARRIVQIMNLLHDENEDGANEAALYAINAIVTKYGDYDDRSKITAQVNNLIKEPTDVWGKEVKSLVEGWESDLEKSWGETLGLAKARTNPRMAREFEERGIQE